MEIIATGTSIKSRKDVTQDLICSICHSILVEPVLLPCGHGFCLNCFNGVVEFNSLTCPYCRKRFSTWLRKAQRDNTVVDQTLWTFIKTNFKCEIQKENSKPKTEGDTAAGTTTTSTVAPDSFLFIDATRAEAAVTAASKNLNRQISQPGEIRKEYEAQLQIFRKELEAEKQNELKATSDFIVQLFKEETKLKTIKSSPPDTPPTTPNETMLVANSGHTPYALNTKKTNCSSSSEAKRNNVGPSSTATSAHGGILVQSIASSSSSSTLIAQPSKCNLIKTLAVRLNRGTEALTQTVHKAIISKLPQYIEKNASTTNKEVLTVPPTNTHRAPSRNSNSADSLKLEMCHFKPIRTVPTTPNKRAQTDILRTPKVKRALKTNIRNNCDKISPDSQSNYLHQTLLQSPRKSAFCYVGTPPKNLSQKSSHCSITISQVKGRTNNQSTINNIRRISKRLEVAIVRNNPVVLLKRCRFTSTFACSIETEKTKQNPGNNKKSTNIKSFRTNGLQLNSKRKYRYNKVIANDKRIETTLLNKIIDEQAKCEKRIEQERKDFELAKKLQAQLNDGKSSRRNSSRKTANMKLFSASSACDDLDHSEPPNKRCRRTCGRTLALNTKVDEAPTTSGSNNSCNLRRSTRQIKPIRK